MSLLVPKTKAREVVIGRERGKGEEKERGCTQREGTKSSPRLESSGLGAEYARKEFKDDGRIWRSGRV